MRVEPQPHRDRRLQFELVCLPAQCTCRRFSRLSRNQFAWSHISRPTLPVFLPKAAALPLCYYRAFFRAWRVLQPERDACLRQQRQRRQRLLVYLLMHSVGFRVRVGSFPRRSTQRAALRIRVAGFRFRQVLRCCRSPSAALVAALYRAAASGLLLGCSVASTGLGLLISA